MDKINLKDERVVDRLRSYFNSLDMSEEEIAIVIEELSDEEKDELIEFIDEEDDENYEEEIEVNADDDIDEIEDIEDDEEEEDDTPKRIESTAISPITRKDMMKMSDLTNEEIVGKFQEGNQNALAALVERIKA